MFFVLEGPESSGKSSVILQLSELLKNRFDVLNVREPGGTWCGEQIRNMCMNRKWFGCDPYTQAALLFSARREQWLQNIQPHLTKGGLVLSDRWHISTYVYQSFIVNNPLIKLKQLESIILEEAIKPVCTFVLYASFETLVKRQKEPSLNVSPYNYAELEMRKNITTAFKDISANEKDIRNIDASLSVEKVSSLIACEIDTILHNNGR